MDLCFQPGQVRQGQRSKRAFPEAGRGGSWARFLFGTGAGAGFSRCAIGQEVLAGIESALGIPQRRFRRRVSGSMPRTIGIDLGTVSLDVCGLDGEDVFLDKTFPTAEVGADPRMLVDLVQSVGPVDLIIGPSGYGLPWLDIEHAGDREIDLMLLADGPEGPRGTIVQGMGKILRALKESGLPLCFSPGVIHLPTVPSYRKVNRSDTVSYTHLTLPTI